MAKHSIAPRDVLKQVRDQKIEFLDLKFVDLFGTLQHLTVPADVVDEVVQVRHAPRVRFVGPGIPEH